MSRCFLADHHRRIRLEDGTIVFHCPRSRPRPHQSPSTASTICLSPSSSMFWPESASPTPWMPSQILNYVTSFVSPLLSSTLLNGSSLFTVHHQNDAQYFHCGYADGNNPQNIVDHTAVPGIHDFQSRTPHPLRWNEASLIILFLRYVSVHPFLPCIPPSISNLQIK